MNKSQMELQAAADILARHLGTYENNLIELVNLADEIAMATTLEYKFVVHKLYCMVTVGRKMDEIKQIVSTWI